ncbi:VPS9A [Symbiodinium sp. KB8]|nr:VPS9A [Symbiodinium sp. KB8]
MMARKSMKKDSLRNSPEAWIQVLEKSAESLLQVSSDWRALSSDTAAASDIEALQRRETSLRECLKRCPWGDPASTASAPRHQSSDALVSAHGLATRAALRCEEEKLSFLLRQEKAKEDEAAARLLSRLGLQRFRLFDIEGAHAALTSAARLQGSDIHLDHQLLEYSTKLLAARSLKFLSADELLQLEELKLVRERLLAASYTESTVMEGAGVACLTEFVLARSDGLLEQRLQIWQQKPGSRTARASTADLVRLFLLHRAIPVSRVAGLLGQDVHDLLLRLQILCKIDEETSRLLRLTTQEPCEPCVFASVAIWPVEGDLLVATDFESTCFSDDTEPVMYLSEDSLALAAAAPRRPCRRLLDLCCGSGIQGIVALRHYATRAVFVDANPRAVGFTRFNLALNGLLGRCDGLLQKDLRCEGLGKSSLFDAILVNPPFMPNPKNIATGASLLFGNGGDCGEEVLSAAVRLASCHLAADGCLAAVSKVPNVLHFPTRLKSWWSADCQRASAWVFHGAKTPARQYMPTAISSGVEPARYQEALSQQGITDLSQAVLLVRVGSGSTSGLEVHLMETLGSVKDSFFKALAADFLPPIASSDRGSRAAQRLLAMDAEKPAEDKSICLELVATTWVLQEDYKLKGCDKGYELLLGLSREQAADRIHKFLSATQDWMLSQVLVFAAEADEAGQANAAEGLEKFLLSRLHARLFAMEPSDLTEDELLRQKIDSFSWVGFDNLGVPPVDTSLLHLAVEQLHSMDKFKAPRDKMVCIGNSCRVINDVLKRAIVASGASRPLSADDFLPLLIYSLILANPPRLHSNIEFVAAFRHPSRLVAEDAYFLTAVQSAVAFIKDAGHKASV